MHVRIARALEELYGKSLEPHYASLALHCEQGAVWDKAHEYLRLSGTQAALRSGRGEAAGLFERALVALGHLDLGAADERDESAARDRQLEAKARLNAALELASQLGMRPLVAHCRLALGDLSCITGKRDEAVRDATTAASMYRSIGMSSWLERAEQLMSRLR